MYTAIAEKKGKTYQDNFGVLALAMMFITDFLPTQNYKSFTNRQIKVTGSVIDNRTGKAIVFYDGNQFIFA